MAFGYTPERAGQVKDRLDSTLIKAEHHVRRMYEVVPGVGAVTSKGDDALDLLREMVGEIHALVDERTDREVA